MNNRWRHVEGFAAGQWEDWAGTGPAATLVHEQGDEDAQRDLRSRFERAVLIYLPDVDPDTLPAEKQACLIDDAMTAVDVEMIAEMVVIDRDLLMPRSPRRRRTVGVAANVGSVRSRR